MIEIAVILIGLAVVIDASIIAVDAVRFDRARVDRRWKRH